MNDGHSMLYLNRQDVEELLPMTEAIDAMAEAFQQLSAGRAQVPVRENLPLQPQGEFLTMPVHLPDLGQVAVKCVSIQPANPARDLPLIQAMVLVFDVDSGRPLALLDGEALTALRTGAASGLATRLLAREDAAVLGLIGAGKQARDQAAAICAVRPIKRVLVSARDPKRTADFCQSMEHMLATPFFPASSINELRAADVICTATTAVEPVLSAGQVSPGTHVNAIGAYRRDMRELSTDLIQCARLFVDHRESCLAEAGEVLIPIEEGAITLDHVIGELGELAADTIQGRSNHDQITVFKSVGNAVQDLAAASRVLENAVKLGRGIRLPL